MAVLAALDWIGEPVSPAQLAPCLGERPATVRYHLLVLEQGGRARVVGTKYRRDTVEYLWVRS